MLYKVVTVILLTKLSLVESILCYNSTHSHINNAEDPFVTNVFEKIFGINKKERSHLRCEYSSLCEDNAMCFVRSWKARDKHAWLVQRGCYQGGHENELLQTLNSPTRAMTCNTQRLPNAEFTVCFCKADWCNTAEDVMSLPLTHIIPLLFTLLF